MRVTEQRTVLLAFSEKRHGSQAPLHPFSCYDIYSAIKDFSNHVIHFTLLNTIFHPFISSREDFLHICKIT